MEKAQYLLWFMGRKSGRSYRAAIKLTFNILLCHTIFRNSKTGFTKLWSPLVTHILCKASEEFTYYFEVAKVTHGGHTKKFSVYKKIF
jgi:hypothetical protein